MLCEIANRAIAAEVRRKSVDNRHIPLPPRCFIVCARSRGSSTHRGDPYRYDLPITLWLLR